MGELSSCITGLLSSFTVVLRPEFLSFHLSGKDLERLAREFVRARIKDPFKTGLNLSPLPGEVDYEMRRISGNIAIYGIPYEGFTVISLYKELIDRAESSLNFIHIAFTRQLLATWEEDDRRYHLRAAIFGYPSIISTTGLVEAPAKPREYYLLKGQFQALGAYDAAVHLEEEFKGRYLAHDDQRLTEVARGYILQALANHLSGHPFCPEKNCRLYNAHWQEEMLEAQLGKGAGLCQRHEELFSGLASP